MQVCHTAVTVVTMHFSGIGMVQCSSSPDCSDFDFGAMSAEDCCVNNPNGFSFSRNGELQCHECIGMMIIIIDILTMLYMYTM